MQGNNGTGQNTQNTGSSSGQKPGLSWSQPQNTMLTSKPAVQQQGSQQPKNTPQTPKDANSKRSLGMIAGGLIVLALVAWAFSASRGKSPEEKIASTATSTEETSADTSATSEKTTSTAPTTSANTVALDTSGSSADLSVPSSQDAGMQVAVSHITVAQPMWAVVYEDHNGTPGNVLGAGLFWAGHESGVVELLRGTLPGQTYFVGEARDDGDRMFSMQNDPAVRTQNGDPLLVTFTTK